MNPDDVIEVVQSRILNRSLSSVERLVLKQSLNNLTYEQMAQSNGYADAHLKDIGYRLWRDMSHELGIKITKKSCLFVMQDYMDSLKVSASKSKPPIPDPSVGFSDSFPSKFIYPSSPLSVDSPLYIERPPCEAIALNEVQRPGGFLRLKAPYKMGKSSLINRVLSSVHQQNYKTVFLDFQAIDSTTLDSIEQLLQWFCISICRELEIPSKLDDYWNSLVGYKMSAERHFQKHILTQSDQPIVVALSSMEALMERTELAKAFLPLLRSWHEKSKWSLIWQQLRLVVIHSTEIYVPLQLNQSPFNIGQVIYLPRFTVGQIYELAQRYELTEFLYPQAEQLTTTIGGHPYLANLALYHFATESITFDHFVQTAANPSGIYGSHLRTYLGMIKDNPRLVEATWNVMNSEQGVELDAITSYQLESLGIIITRDRQAFPSCDIYRRFFQQQLKL